MLINYPRIIIAGISGDSGKTMVSCGLLSLLRERRLSVAAYKKGPDYIDPAWHTLASGTTARNLDTYLMPGAIIRESFLRNSLKKDISIIEGNRGLFDGMDVQGSQSTAELARILNAPVILVLPVHKMTRSSAAIALGFKLMDKEINIAGIILNQATGKRHIQIAKASIEEITGIPVLGAIPKIAEGQLFPFRHLGLFTPAEYSQAEKAVENAKNLVKEYIDIDKILGLAYAAPLLDYNLEEKTENIIKKVKIGYFYDNAFTFYYPENLEALEKAGAELIKISSIENKNLPELDGLYIGGGFPETNIKQITENKQLMIEIKAAAEKGLPIYAECGGLIYLSNSIKIDSADYPLAGIFPVNINFDSKPQGHGYTEGRIDKENIYLKTGRIIRGHEFHYTYINEITGNINTCMALTKGTGAIDKRDGLIYKNVFASYVHIHSASCPEWAENFVKAAGRMQK